MKTSAFYLVCLAVLCAAPFPAQAQHLPVNQVEGLSRAAHDNMASAMVGGKLLTQEQYSKLVYPLAPYDVRERTVITGHLAGFAQWCGLSWDKMYFMPYMARVRAEHKDWNDSQFAYVAVLHGVSMQSAIRSKGDQTCSEEEKKTIIDAVKPQ